jgi:predicted nuclease of predicted toxin-antitoxin system
MKFLLDQDVYAATARFLRGLGHDVVTVGELGRHQSTDSDLLLLAQQMSRIFITRDRDFGGLVFVRGITCGVIYLRILPASLTAVHQELKTLLSEHSEDELKKTFAVVEHGRHRLRKL